MEQTNSEKFLSLAIQSLIMLLGSFLIGSLPVFIKLNRSYLDRLTLSGSVLLASLVLVNILPEGFETLTDTYDEKNFNLEISQIAGIFLILGFLLVLMIDLVFGLHSETSNSNSSEQQNQTPNAITSSVTLKYFGRCKLPNLLSIGFVFHATCDGIALGAAIYSGNSNLNFSIFIGLFIHKLVVGLTLVLNMIKKFQKKEILSTLFMFSIACPVGGFFTLLILTLISADGDSILPGCLILMSTGTLFYIALCHSLPESIAARQKQGHSHGQHLHTNSTVMREIESDESIISDSQNLLHEPTPIDKIDYCLIFLVIILPIFMSLFLSEE